LSLFKNRDFLKIWLAQMFSQLSLNMINFALVLRMYSLTGRITAVSLVLIASALPSVLFGPFSGVIADRLNYKRILTYTNVFRILITILIIFANGNMLAVLEVIFLMNLVTQFFAPAESSSFPLIVNKDRLIQANSISMATLYATILVGYSIAGPILSLISAPIFFVICASFYLISAFLVYNMSDYDKKIERRLSFPTLANDITAVWNELREGLIYLYNDKRVFSPMVKFAIGWAVLGSFIVLLPGFGETALSIEAQDVGWMVIGPAGFGMFCGAYFLQKKNNSKDSIFDINIGYLLTSIGMLLLLAFPLYATFEYSRVLMVVFTLLVGFGTAMVYIAAQTTLHLNSEEKMRGRVFGITMALVNLAMSLPALFIAGLADLTTPLIAMFIIVIFLVFFTIYIFSEREKKIRFY